MGLLSFSKLFLIIAWFRAQGLGLSWRLRRKKGSQPRLAALGSPFQGKGLARSFPPSYGRRCPEGAKVGWGWRCEKERGNASQVDDIREHPIHRWRGPPSPMGKAAIREYRFSRYNAFPAWGRQRGSGFAAKKEANPASLRSAAPSKGRGSRGRSLLPMEGGATKGRIRIKCSAVLCKSIYESSIIKQVIWTGWGLVTTSGVTPPSEPLEPAASIFLFSRRHYDI